MPMLAYALALSMVQPSLARSAQSPPLNLHQVINIASFAPPPIPRLLIIFLQFSTRCSTILVVCLISINCLKH